MQDIAEPHSSPTGRSRHWLRNCASGPAKSAGGGTQAVEDIEQAWSQPIKFHADLNVERLYRRR